MKHYFAVFVFLFLCTGYSFSQVTVEKEEINVINDLLLKMIKAEKLVSFNKTIVYFDLKQDCDLNQIFKVDYKNNKLINKLKNSQIESRLIDSTKIKKINGIQLLFNDTINYNNIDYLSDKIIRTLSISRISFNKSFNIGYFYYSIYCGEDCGWGFLVKIQKLEGVWTITKHLIGYVS